MSRVNPVGGELAGKWLSKFLTDHLAGEPDLSTQTIASYRDAVKLWLETERGNSAATHNQRLAVIKSLARCTAVERPEFLDQATQILAIKRKKPPATDMGHLTGDEVKALLAEPDPTTRRAARPMVVTLRGKRNQDQAGPADGPHSPAGRRLP